MDRRQWMAASALFSVTLLDAQNRLLSSEFINLTNDKAGNLSLATFQFDVTPPKNHPLCGGWIKPVVAVDDKLQALGFIILGAGKPIVVCSVDWTGLLNDAHVQWRTALAQAAGTSADRVAVQCVHQHNAPFACLDAQRIVKAVVDLPDIVEVDFFRKCLDKARSVVKSALKKTRSLTHIAHSQAKVQKVASNRRFVDKNNKIQFWRGSSTKSKMLQQLPSGLIDPWLKTIAFYDGKTKIAACHYYATHPMSYYGDGRVSSDFAGLARKKRQTDEPDCLHLYFTGCAGNIAAGKYNNGTPKARRELTDRVYQAIVQSEKNLQPQPIQHISWTTANVQLPPTTKFSDEALKKRIHNKKNSTSIRNRSAYRLAWSQRCQEGKTPIVLSCLNLNQTSLLHLPAECFVEYQLAAQKTQPKRFVATAAYGDGGPWYIPTKEAYPQGGYEVSVAFCDPKVDPLLVKKMKPLLTQIVKAGK